MSVTHNGTNIDNYLISYELDTNLCAGVGVVRVDLAITYPTPINLYDIFIVYEDGIKKGTFYCHTTNKDLPSAMLSATCQDASLKLEEYFIAESIYIDYPSDSATWIAKFLGDATVGYVFDSGSTGSVLPNETTLGMMSAMDQITSLLQQNSWFLRFDADNICHIGRINVNLENEAISVSDEQILSISTVNHDRMFRNRALVWGKGDPATKRWVYADLNQSGKYDNEYDANDVRTVVMANSNISSVASAKLYASRLLKEFEKTNFEIELTLAGYYNLKIGDVLRVKSEFLNTNGIVTTLATSLSSNGAVTNIKLNERCPRLFSFYEYDGYVYVGTQGAGVWKKPLKYTHVWSNFSEGLTNLNITDLAIKDGTYACVTEDGKLFTRFLGDASWSRLSPNLFNPVTSGYVASGVCTSCAIDKTTNNILATFTVPEEGIGWVVDATSSTSYQANPIVDELGEYAYTPTGIDNNGTENVVIANKKAAGVSYPNNHNYSYSLLTDLNMDQLATGFTISADIDFAATGNTIPGITTTFRADLDYVYQTSVSSNSATFQEYSLETKATTGYPITFSSVNEGVHWKAENVFLLGNRILYSIQAVGFTGVRVYKIDFNTRTVTNVADGDLYDAAFSDYFTLQRVAERGYAGFTYTSSGAKIVAFCTLETDPAAQDLVDSDTYVKAFYYDTVSNTSAFTSPVRILSGKISAFNIKKVYAPSTTMSNAVSNGDMVSLLYRVTVVYGANRAFSQHYTLVTFKHNTNSLTINDQFADLFFPLASVSDTDTPSYLYAHLGYDVYFIYEKVVSQFVTTWFVVKLSMNSQNGSIAKEFYGNIFARLIYDQDRVVLVSQLTEADPIIRMFDLTHSTLLGGTITTSKLARCGTQIIDGSFLWFTRLSGTTNLYKYNINTSAETVFSAINLAGGTNFTFHTANVLVWSRGTRSRFYFPNTRLASSTTSGGSINYCFKGYKQSPYRKVTNLGLSTNVEISQTQPVMLYGGISYSGIVVSGNSTGYGLGEILFSPTAQSGTFSSVLLDSTKSLIADARSMRWLEKDALGEPDPRTYIVYPEITNFLIWDTNTKLKFIDVTYDLRPVYYPNSASGIMASGVTTFHTFSGFANHIETTNNQDFPYIFASISGGIFWQKDAHEWDAVETVFENRTSNLPNVDVTCIRVDDSL